MSITPSPSSPPIPASSQSSQAVVTNGIRLTAVAEKLASHFHGTITLSTTELYQLCFAFARGIDYALSSNDVPGVAHSIPVLIKKAFPYRHEPALRSALMVLIISAKNACNNNWFQEDDRKQILAMANELSSNFCLSGLNPDAIDAVGAINEITPRFYPQIKLTRLIFSFEVKSGYAMLMSDFFIQRNIPASEKIRLYVIQRDNFETSSCIAHPPLVSFIVNGKGVERRNNVTMEPGPQVPTDITKMLKYGTNIIQTVGYFNGNYIVAVAFTSKLSTANPILEDYTEPSAEIESDSEIIEGPSTVSLNCPISFGRIKTPVKGYQCRHHQCFDYDNYMQMNSRKPTWRCPHCNRPVCALDIRLDQKTVKILKEVDKSASHITILSDGTWKKVEEHEQIQQAENINSKGKTAYDIIDLTSEENDESVEVEDTKPILDHQVSLTGPQGNTLQASHPHTSILHAAEDNAWLRNTFSPAHGTLESLLPNSLRSNTTGSSSLHLQPHLQHSGSASPMDSIPRNTMQMSRSMQTLATPRENPSRRIGSGMLNTTLFANGSGAGLQLPPSATITVATDGNFASPLGSVPPSFVTAQNLSQTPPNRSYQSTMSVSAQRSIPSPSSSHRVPNSFRMPSSILGAPNPSPNVSALLPPQQSPLFPPVRIPTSIQGSLRTHNQPSLSTPLRDSGSGLPQHTASASVQPELAPEQDWRPTGRMRGSLTGDAYSAALNNYLEIPNNIANPNLNPNTSTGGGNAEPTLTQTGRPRH